MAPQNSGQVSGIVLSWFRSVALCPLPHINRRACDADTWVWELVHCEMGTTISNQTPYRAVLPAVVTLGTVIDSFAPIAPVPGKDMRVWQRSSAIWEPVITVFIFAPRSPGPIAQHTEQLRAPRLLLHKL